jgi:hypothetical protein
MTVHSRIDRRALLPLAACISALNVSLCAQADDTTPVDELSATGMVQIFGTAWDQDESGQADPAGFGDPEADPGVGIQRARIGLVGKRGPVDGLVEFGMAAPLDAPSPDFGFGVIEANVAGNFAIGANSLRVSAGLQKVPFSRDLLISIRDQMFLERTVAGQWMSPVRDVGAIADFQTAFGLRARAAVFNGSNSIYGDDNAGKSLVGRLEYAKGDTYRSWSPKGESAFGIAVAALRDGGLATNTTSFNADLLVRVAGVNLTLEATQASEEPLADAPAQPSVLDPTVSRGLSGQVSYFIPVGKKNSGIEPGIRFSSYDPATWAEDNGDVAIINAGAMWRQAVPGVDLGVGYIHRVEVHGRTIPNDTARMWVQFADRRKIAAN